MKTYLTIILFCFSAAVLADKHAPALGQAANKAACVPQGCGPCYQRCLEANSTERNHFSGDRNISSKSKIFKPKGNKQ